ncbi:UNVERIFIED_CONTAM: hypothetical protein Sangu_2722200 [Sesamum angustifolium]|uniref:Uncharacterized protein n=1 Tax=Sesamum angustifolium TaxID=2727405 RepID=A0AAW2IZ66_9LAMI
MSVYANIRVPDVVNMFNQLLQDKALSENKVLEVCSSAKRPLAKSPPSTLTSSVSTKDPKGRHQVDPLSTPAKRAKGSVGSLAPFAFKLALRAGTPRHED